MQDVYVEKGDKYEKKIEFRFLGCPEFLLRVANSGGSTMKKSKQSFLLDMQGVKPDGFSWDLLLLFKYVCLCGCI